MKFDERGNLVEPVELNLGQFREIFVDKWQSAASTRPAIFEVFETYILDFRNLITPDFVMWIDGSFVTIKRDNPGDIDFVSFVDSNVYDTNEAFIENRFVKYGAKNHYGMLLDAYICPIYPPEHEYAIRTKSNQLEWLHLFSYTKPDRQKKKYAKSFIKIKFNGNE